MIEVQAVSSPGSVLENSEIKQTIQDGLEGGYSSRKVLVLIPDHTRSLPLPMLFRTLVEILSDTKQLDFMVALGTHPPLTEGQLNKLVGITEEERVTTYKHIGLLNHAWDDPSKLKTIGMITEEEVRRIAQSYWHPSLAGSVDVRVNGAATQYDHILILGPTFPHEVAGYSGGAKYLFPGISGPEMINVTHWLGALAGVVGTIGVRDTVVRDMIHVAARKLPVPVTLIALVVGGHDLVGMYIGDYIEAWRAAADLSSKVHIRWCDKSYSRVLSCAPTMYDELWTAAKAMYKLEPVVAIGGELIIYAPHLDTVSRVHGEYIYKIGYHILPHFLQDWEKYRHIPLGVLAHSTHVRGGGIMEGGVEKPNVRVTLASKIPPEDCERLSLGYQDPALIDIEAWKHREDEGLLYVPKAGEILYRLKAS
jgi:nickel-dependent lactate racemase